MNPIREKLGGRRRWWHLHGPCELTEVTPWAQVNDLGQSVTAISILAMVVEMSSG
jgi:hypothetical protein